MGEKYFLHTKLWAFANRTKALPALGFVHVAKRRVKRRLGDGIYLLNTSPFHRIKSVFSAKPKALPSESEQAFRSVFFPPRAKPFLSRPRSSGFPIAAPLFRMPPPALRKGSFALRERSFASREPISPDFLPCFRKERERQRRSSADTLMGFTTRSQMRHDYVSEDESRGAA